MSIRSYQIGVPLPIGFERLAPRPSLSVSNPPRETLIFVKSVEAEFHCSRVHAVASVMAARRSGGK